MATKLPNASRSAACAAVVGLVDAHATLAGYIEIRTGAQPADPDSAVSGTLLVTIPLNDPAFGAPTDGVAAADVVPALTAAAVAAGVAGWFRCFDGAAASVFDGDVTGTGGGGDIELNNVNIASGQDVTITSLTATMPDTE